MFKALCILFAFAPGFSWACSCAEYSSALKGILSRTNVSSIVVVVENTQNLGHGVRVRVAEVLYGNLDKSEINIWGDPGMLCRGPVINGVGRRWVAAITKLTSPNQGEAVGDYETMSCMDSSLKIDGEEVIGTIVGQSTETKMKLEEFKSVLKSPKDFLVPQVTCQINTVFQYFDDHVDYFKKYDTEVAFNGPNGSVALEFIAKSEEGKDFPGHFEGIIMRESPEQLFSPAKLKGQVSINDLIKPMVLDQPLQQPVNIYSRFVAGRNAQNSMQCNSDVKLK